MLSVLRHLRRRLFTDYLYRLTLKGKLMEAFLFLAGLGIALLGFSFIIHGFGPLVHIETNHFHGEDDDAEG